MHGVLASAARDGHRVFEAVTDDLTRFYFCGKMEEVGLVDEPNQFVLGGRGEGGIVSIIGLVDTREAARFPELNPDIGVAAWRRDGRIATDVSMLIGVIADTAAKDHEESGCDRFSADLSVPREFKATVVPVASRQRFNDQIIRIAGHSGCMRQHGGQCHDCRMGRHFHRAVLLDATI